MNKYRNLKKFFVVYSFPMPLLLFCSLIHSPGYAQQDKGPPVPNKQPLPGLEGAQPVPVPPGLRLNNRCLSYISNIKKLPDYCPTTDPADAQIKREK